MLRVPRQVLVYIFRRLQDGSVEFLLLKRTDEWGGFWQGVSGAPEWGETDDEGAIREVREETGFSVASSLQPIDFRYVLLREEDPDKERWEHVYGPEVRAIPGRGLRCECARRHRPGARAIRARHLQVVLVQGGFRAAHVGEQPSCAQGSTGVHRGYRIFN